MIVSVKNAELFYSTRGRGPALMVLSGMGARPYECLTPTLLSDHFTLVFVDLRGSGLSTGEPTTLSFEVLAGDLEAIRVDLGVERVAVLGHSVLGMLAIEYGRRRPRSVSHVIVAGTPPRGDMAWLSSKAASFFEEDASGDRKQVLQERMARSPSGASLMQTVLGQTPLRFFDARFDAAPLFADSVGRPQLLTHVMGTLGSKWDITVEVSSLHVPLFIAHGRYDYTVPWVLWNGVVERLPNATLEIFGQSSHHPFFEEPERFVAVLRDWMMKSR